MYIVVYKQHAPIDTVWSLKWLKAKLDITVKKENRIHWLADFILWWAQNLFGLAADAWSPIGLVWFDFGLVWLITEARSRDTVFAGIVANLLKLKYYELVVQGEFCIFVT